MASPSVFVGRRAELEEMTRAAARGETVLVTADAGGGKTRLVQELTGRLKADGVSVWAAGCLPLAQRLPLLPVIEVLRQQQLDDSGDRFRAALDHCPSYVRDDLALIMPELGPAREPAIAENWQQQRLFAAVTRLWREMARGHPGVVVIEDLHWSDETTRDFLTYALALGTSLPLVLTTRTDEPVHDGDLRAWLQQSARAPMLVRVVLGALSRDDVGALADALTGATTPPRVVDDLLRRTEGNPFFVEQLVASGSYGPQAVLPDELEQMLRARADSLAPLPRRVLDLLAVSARPLTEDEVVAQVGQPVEALRSALRDLLAAQLIRRDGPTFAPRHALVAEAVAGALLPGELAGLNAAVADILTRRDDRSLWAEAALHWSRAGHQESERHARRQAARYAESIYAHVEAAVHWERAFDLGRAGDPAAAEDALHAMRAWEAAGQQIRGQAIGERGHRVAALHGQRSLEAVLRARVAGLYALTDRKRGLDELAAAVQAFQRLDPSAEQVAALHLLFELHRIDGVADVGRPFLDQAVALCRMVPLPVATRVRPLTTLALEQMETGDVDTGLATLEEARRGADDDLGPQAGGWLAVAEAYAFRTLNLLEESAEAAQHGLAGLATAGLDLSFTADLLRANLVDAWLGRGRVAAAATLIDAARERAPANDSDVLCALSVRIEILRGRLEEAASLLQRLLRFPIRPGLEMSAQFARTQAELSLWQGSADVAVGLIGPLIERLLEARQEQLAAPLFVLAMRACADLVESAAARRDDEALAAARRQIRSLQQRLRGAAADPFAEHPFHVLGAAERREWEAETSRASCEAGAEDRVAHWTDVARQWQKLRRPHREGYARWRQAEAQLRTGGRSSATVTLATAWQLADQHEPLRAEVSSLARLARIEVAPRPVERPPLYRTAVAADSSPHGLTAREMDVLRLLGEGLTNAQIGVRLYLSSKTVSVHVTAILRKLEAVNRVHAAAIAERAGVLTPRPEQ